MVHSTFMSYVQLKGPVCVCRWDREELRVNAPPTEQIRELNKEELKKGPVLGQKSDPNF